MGVWQPLYPLIWLSVFPHLLIDDQQCCGRLALSVKSWPHDCEAGVRSGAGCSVEQGT